MHSCQATRLALAVLKLVCKEAPFSGIMELVALFLSIQPESISTERRGLAKDGRLSAASSARFEEQNVCSILDYVTPQHTSGSQHMYLLSLLASDSASGDRSVRSEHYVPGVLCVRGKQVVTWQVGRSLSPIDPVGGLMKCGGAGVHFAGEAGLEKAGRWVKSQPSRHELRILCHETRQNLRLPSEFEAAMGPLGGRVAEARAAQRFRELRPSLIAGLWFRIEDVLPKQSNPDISSTGDVALAK